MKGLNKVLLRFRRLWVLLIPTGFMMLMSACSTTSATGKSALTLKQGEGLAGFEFVAFRNGGDFQIKLAGFTGDMLKMNNVSAGENIYLFKLSAGSYCVQALYMSGGDGYVYIPDKNLPCFSVHPGKLTYGGTVTNSLVHFYTIDLGEFLHALKESYPAVYERYVVGPKPVEHPVY